MAQCITRRVTRRVDYSSAFKATLLNSEHLQVLECEDLVPLLHNPWYRLPPSVAMSTEPITYEDMLADLHSKEWQIAADEEIAALIKHGTWTLVPPPPDRQLVKSKWVFRIKRDDSGNIIKYKARLCACGYSQIQGLDYHEIYAPVVKGESLRAMLTIVASRNMHLHQMDVASAFLHGNLHEEIFMQQPKGYIDPSIT